MTLETTIKELDLFSLPFQFQMGKNEKSKKTILGGMTSLVIILTSVSYLVYLTTLFFTNQLQPKIAIYEEFSFDEYEMTFLKDYLRLSIILQNGSTLSEYEKQTKKTFLQLIGSFRRNVDGKQLIDDFYLKECSDDSKHFCLEFKESKESTIMHYDQKDDKKTQMYILFAECIKNFQPPGQSCATADESKELLLSLQNVIKLQVNLQQYNVKDKEFQAKNKQETYLFDKTTGFFSLISLNVAKTKVKDGFLIQSSNEYANYSDYQRTDIALQKDFLSQAFNNVNLFGVILIRLGGTKSIIEIQYPQYTEVLAQFSSILNSLLFLGLFVKLIAQTEIVQDLAQIQLQNYYKKAAFRLLSKDELSKFSNKGISSIIDLNNYITTLDLQKKWSQSLNLNFYKKLKIFLFSSFGNKKQEDQTQQQKVFEGLVKQTNLSLSIYSIQRELLQIKTIMKMFLSPEQYAAIQLCGCDIVEFNDTNINNLEKDNTNHQITFNNIKEESLKLNTNIIYKEQKLDTPESEKDSSRQQKFFQKYEKNKVIPVNNITTNNNVQTNSLLNIKQSQIQLNHLEKVDMVDKDQNYFKQCVEQFIQKVQQNKNDKTLKYIDERILDCIISAENNNNLSIKSEAKDSKQTQLIFKEIYEQDHPSDTQILQNQQLINSQDKSQK